jgi:phage host-nuclease inhibitor protein Gam
MSKTKKAKVKLTAPASRLEAEAIMTQVALTLNNQRRITAVMEARVLKVREEYATSLGLCAEGVARGTERLKLWALANPAEFEKAKSVQFPAGTVGFRTGMPKLALLNRKWNWTKALEAMQRLMPKFIRQKPEIAADVILCEREEPSMKLALPAVGLKIVQDETFFVEARLEHLPVRQSSKTEEKEAA